jgi:hypothetical protein
MCRTKASPIPIAPPAAADQLPMRQPEANSVAAASTPTKKPHVQPSRQPILRFEIRDLSSPGVSAFLSAVNVGHALQEAVTTTLDLLYADLAPSDIPPTRSVTLIIHDFEGVAYTTGTELDDDHKEIHLSSNYIARTDRLRLAAEMRGVLVHEMVHCWQWAAQGTAPGGLVEGMADWVRLRARLGPPHWKRVWRGCTWDAGYEKTGYFLDWLEETEGEGTVRRINMALREGGYEHEGFWIGCCRQSVESLWKRYGDAMERKRAGGD